MTEILVDPVSVHGYGQSAERSFSSIQTDLHGLVNEVVGVHYEGGNAFTFKTEAGTIATTFANNLSTDIAAMADAIRTSTSNIATELGNEPVTITVSTEPFTAPTPSGKSDTAAVETDGLEKLIGIVTRYFDTIRTSISDHQASLEGTNWKGRAKDTAVEQVGALTRAATTRANTTEESLTTYIRRQIASVTAADV